MKFKINIIICLLVSVYSAFSQSLGNYSSATISAGGNIDLSPAGNPANATRISVSASGIFSGLVTAKLSNGVVSVTDAKPVGVYTITVKAYNSSGGSAIKSFTLTVTKPGCSQGTFSGNSQIGAGPNQNNIAIGDFNGDGRQDLALAHEGYNTLSIRMGDGHGGFTGNTEIATGSHPYNLAIGDFNLDGKQDIANTNQGSNRVTVLFGNGQGGFSPNQSLTTAIGPVGIAIGDFNNDGWQDIVTANLNESNITVFMGTGSGNFSSAAYFSVAPYPSAVAVGDFNGDGNQDIATTSGGNSTISIRLGNGQGSFSGTTEIPVGQNPYNLAIGDFNQDGNLDIATANYLGNTVSIRLGNGAGNFTGNTEVPVGYSPYSVAIGNFNGDNFQDIITANYFGNTASIRFGDGQGGFSGTTDLAVGSYPICVVVGDFNNDGFQEFAVANYFDQTVSIRMGVAGSPPPVFAYANGPFCEGLNLQLNASGGNQYSWTGPNGFSSSLQNPLILSSTTNNSGTYTVTTTTSTGCIGTTSTSINVNTNPVVSFTLPTDTLCVYDPSVALSGSPLGGTFSGTGISGNEFLPSVSGAGLFPLTYTYTNSSGCVDSSDQKMYVLLCTGVAENEIEKNISVYPNPVTDHFSVDLSGIEGSSRINLFSADGKIVKSYGSLTNVRQTFSASQLASGMYYLKIFTDEKTFVLRVVKQ